MIKYKIRCRSSGDTEPEVEMSEIRNKNKAGNSRCFPGVLRRAVSAVCCASLLLLALSSCASRFTSEIYSAGSLETEPAQPVSTGIPDPDSEVRGVFIASVYNINFPSSSGLAAAKLAAELDDIVSTVASVGCNAIYFQVRPSGDALYESDIFPYSSYVSGTQGVAPDGNFDCLAYLIEKAHARNILVHAWVNPLRVTVGSQAAPAVDVSALAADNPARKDPSLCVAYADGRLYYDPGLPAARSLIADGVREIAENYDVDGIIFDDYFYPYPTYINMGGTNVIAEFDDSASYAAYGAGASLGDWRRGNVNELVKLCYNAAKEGNKNCLFGVAPFGIWQNDDGENGGSDTAGAESYSAIYCDTLAWVEGGYVDYVAPQIYWSFSTSVARYDNLVRWWNSRLAGTGVDLLISHGVYRYEDLEDPDGEIARQIEFARSELCYTGSIHYGYASIKNNTKGVADELRKVYSREVVCGDAVSNGSPFVIASPQSGTKIDGGTTYIIGSADPTASVLFDGRPVSLTKSGCFSVQAELAPGENTLVFTCDGKEYTHSLYRDTKEGGKDYAVMSAFEVIYPYPSERETVASGGVLEVSCTAPHGSTVTASLGDRTVYLTGILGNSGGGEEYVAEIYRGTLELGTLPENSLASLGELRFRAVRGTKTAQASGGEIRLLGENTGIKITVTQDYTHLKADTDSSFYDDYTPQVPGMTSYAVGESDGYWLLTMGGYVSLEETEEGELSVLPGSTVLRQVLQTTDNGDTVFYIKTPGKPAFDADLTGENLVFTFFDCTVSDNALTRDTASSIVSQAALVDYPDSGCVRLELALYDEMNFYGFHFAYTTVSGVSLLKITLNAPPATAKDGLLLAGRVIALDAGHGGIDTGALGAFGAGSGKNEADVNLAVVLRLRDKLESLDATVVLTRAEDVTLELEDREAMLLELVPDLAVIVHQNSMPYTADIARIRGVAAFYCADSGKLLARCLSDGLCAALNRSAYEPGWLTLMLCRNHRFVSALVETGFMTSVEEYERMLSEEGIEATAQGICDGILDFFRRSSEY